MSDLPRGQVTMARVQRKQGMTDHETEALNAIRTVLRSGECRIETGFSFSVKGTHATVQLYRRGSRRWVKVGPLLLPPDGKGLPELLEMIANLSRPDDEVAG